MQYSWPGPVPPGGRQGTIRLIRCARCGGPLYHTKTKGQPRQEDHEQGCEAFISAIQVMRYVDELKGSASESAVAWAAPGGGGTCGRTRRNCPRRRARATPSPRSVSLATSIKPNAKRAASESSCLRRRKWRKR